MRGASVGALIGYLIVTLAFTWPLALNFTRAIPGDGFDGWQNYWNLWWMKVALLEKHTWPFFTDLLYHPTGVGLLFHTLNPFNGLLSLPVQVAFGLFAAYNAVVLFSFTLAGLGAYLLARQMLGPQSSRLAAFAAGAIFTFAPVHIAHLLGHMQVISLEWLPFFALYLLSAALPPARPTSPPARPTSPPAPPLQGEGREDKAPPSLVGKGAGGLGVTSPPAPPLQGEGSEGATPPSRAGKGVEGLGVTLAGKGVGGLGATSPPAPPLRGEGSGGATPPSLVGKGVGGLGVTLVGKGVGGLGVTLAGKGVGGLGAILLAAFFLALIALCDWYYVLYSLIFSAVVAVWLLLTRPWRRALDGLLAIAAIWLLWGVALSPLLWPMVAEASRYRFMVPDPAQSRLLSADLLAFVTPHGFHPLWGAWAREQSKIFTSSISEYTVFAGYVVLALAALGVWPRPGKAAAGRVVARNPGRVERPFHRMRAFWLLVLLVFFVLSLGPVLHIGGRTALLPAGREIPLPYGWLVRAVPFMEITRSVSRYDVMVMLALSMLAAWGVDRLWRGGRWCRGLALAGCVGFLFEFLPAPYPLSPADTPAWYRALAADGRSAAVLNLPMNWDRPGYLLYQTVHGKPLTAAYISREDPRTLVERAPVLQHFRHLGPDIIAFDLRGQGMQVLADLGVGWVVLDRYKMPGGAERSVTEALAAEIFAGRPALYADERLTVYEVVPPARVAPYLILAPGWEPLDKQERTRAFIGRADVIVRAPAAGSATLRIVLAPGSAALDAAQAGEAFVVPLALHPGDNIVPLRSRQPGQRVIVRELVLQ